MSAPSNTTLELHWPEYLMEAATLGIFMISVCVFSVLLEDPASELNQAFASPVVRRALAGAAVGLTMVALISSSWGQRSGAHMNPAVTLTYYALGKIAAWDTGFYIAAQFAGALAGVAVANLALGFPLGDNSVNFAATLPDSHGPWLAFGAELSISAVMMLTILSASNSRRFMRWTPYFAGALVALYMTFETPFSGMSMNPARTVASAAYANEWSGIWVYLTAPPLGMLLAALIYRGRVFCAKLSHAGGASCIFRCGFRELIEHRSEYLVSQSGSYSQR